MNDITITLPLGMYNRLRGERHAELKRFILALEELQVGLRSGKIHNATREGFGVLLTEWLTEMRGMLREAPDVREPYPGPSPLREREALSDMAPTSG